MSRYDPVHSQNTHGRVVAAAESETDWIGNLQPFTVSARSNSKSENNVRRDRRANAPPTTLYAVTTSFGGTGHEMVTSVRDDAGCGGIYGAVRIVERLDAEGGRGEDYGVSLFRHSLPGKWRMYRRATGIWMGFQMQGLFEEVRELERGEREGRWGEDKRRCWGDIGYIYAYALLLLRHLDGTFERAVAMI